jgi:parallel beta-helix repeat protein
MTKPSVRWNRFAAVVFLVLLFSSAFLVNQAKPETTRPIITIQQDGTVNPDSASIRRDGDTYTFTGNVYAEISVQKSNIIIDGAGYTLQGTYNGTNESAFMIGQGPNQVPNGTKAQFSMGIDLAFPSVLGVTIMNLNIKNFSIGMYIWTMNNTITGNAVTESIVGILLSGSDNRITHNYVARNKMGVFFGWAEAGEIPEGIQISHNSFDHNEQHLSGCVCEDFNLTETPHTWDDGKEGNFWSDYNGTDANGDGIGDKPYSIDVLNEDRYPLMNSPAAPPTIALQIPGEVIALTIAFAIVVVAAVAVRRRKKTRVKLST